MKKLLVALWRVLAVVFVLFALGCTQDMGDSAEEDSDEFRLGKFKLENDEDLKLAKVVLQLPQLASSRGISEAHSNTNYYECWGFFRDAMRTDPNHYYWEQPINPINADEVPSLPGGFIHDGLVEIWVDPGRWDFIVLAGNKGNYSSDTYYYNYAQTFAQNAAGGKFGRPLLLASGTNKDYEVKWGERNIIPMPLQSVDFAFKTLDLVPASKADEKRYFVINYQAAMRNDLLAVSPFGLLNLPKGSAVDIRHKDRDSFQDITVLNKVMHEFQQDNLASDPSGRYTAVDKWGFVAPILNYAVGEIRVLNWYVHAFVIPPSNDNKAVLGTDPDGNVMYRNQWAIADAKNPVAKTNWPLTSEQRDDNTLGAVFRKEIIFDENVPPPSTWIDVEWGY